MELKHIDYYDSISTDYLVQKENVAYVKPLYAFINGYNKCVDIVKDNMFTDEDMQKMFLWGTRFGYECADMEGDESFIPDALERFLEAIDAIKKRRNA